MDSESFFFEIQIQTKQMYTFNMFGIASHTSYKGLSDSVSTLPKWMKKLLSKQKKGLKSKNFIDKLNPNSLKDSIICTSPDGKEVELPKKATILDFAYKVHSDI
jgi:GTP pyrophosphokinase